MSLSVVACHVGDWVEVQSDYSPGICSEGGTGVVVAVIEGKQTSQIEKILCLSLNDFTYDRSHDREIHIRTC